MRLTETVERSGGFALAAGIALIASLPVGAEVTMVADGRSTFAQLSVTPHTSSDVQSDVPPISMGPFVSNLNPLASGMCTTNGGGNAFFNASTAAGQDSMITLQSATETRFTALGSANASLPLNGAGSFDCGSNTTTGSAMSTFRFTFTTDIDHELFIAGSITNATFELSYDEGMGPVSVHSVVGTGSLGFYQILGPSTYTVEAVAQADQDGDHSSFEAYMTFVESPGSSAGAGRVDQLLIDKASAGQLQLVWQPSCSTDDDDYAIYAGDLGDFMSHTMKACSTVGNTADTISPLAGDRYYLVVPLEGALEGSYGRDGAGLERPIGLATCGTQDIATSCP